MQSNLENGNEFVFTIETNIKNVMNTIELVTSREIQNAEIRYVDDYGYEKVASLLNIEEAENKKVLTFQYFYTNKFDLVIIGDIVEESIQDLKIIPLNQNEFYEDKDIDVRLDKNILTATSLCGQYSSNAPIYAIDGDEGTTFHSATYTNYAPYGDFIVELEKPYLLDRLKMTTRASGNGRIKAYEILYRTDQNEDWKKIFEQLTEESGVKREAIFKPVLASQVCIRTTNGHNNFVVIGEIDLFKFNFIENRIKNLFLDEEETTLRPGVTLEEIETLQSELSTDSYAERVAVAKELYILGLSQNYFSIPLNGEKIFDKVQFTTTERVLRVHLKYIDVYGNEVLVQTDFESIGTLYTLNMNKIMTNSASIIMYGVLNIDNISINNYDRSNFYIDEDVDLRIPFQKIIGSTTNPNNSYPISNMFDGNWNSQFHCSQYGEHCDIYFKLDKEYLIDKLSLVSYRSNTSGLINKFKVLVKDTNNDNSWAELGGYTVDSYANKWLEVKNSTPYLTNEVCVRIEDSVNKWALICELELFIHSNLEKSINGLYLDDTFTSLRDDVSYEEILELEAKNLVTPDFIEKIAKAKELYIIKLPQNNFCLELSEERIFDKVQFITSERVLRAHIKYVDTYGVERLIESGFETLGNIYTLNINKIMTEDASLVLYGVSKIDEVSTNSFK
ncbi:MAG: discoidin domain-containing protein, partial [Cetobacterium sp.]